MGKKGQFSLFESYTSAFLPNDNNNQDPEYTPLPDSMRTSTLLEQIGKEYNWGDEQVDHDIDILESNRLYLVRDLRVLSNQSWLTLELLPIVRDLLQQSVYPTLKTQIPSNTMAVNLWATPSTSPTSLTSSSTSSQYNEYLEAKMEKKKKKKEKKEKKNKDKHTNNEHKPSGEAVVPSILMGGRDELALAEHLDTYTITSSEMIDEVLSEDIETIRNTIRNGSIDLGKEESLLLDEENKDHQQLHTADRKKSVSFSNKDGTIPINDNEYIDNNKKKDKKKEKKMKKDKKQVEKEESSCSSSSCSSSSSDDSSCDDDESTTAPTTPPTLSSTTNGKSSSLNKDTSFGLRPIKAVSGSRIQVKTSNGDIFECDRHCPHKGVDLNTWGQVLGNTLVCTKHNWRFNLDGNGMGPKGRNLHPCKVNDW